MADTVSSSDADDREVVLRVLPAGWREKARELGALRDVARFRTRRCCCQCC